ncbi:MAG: hypothetical protein ACHBN1_10275 [Heteroscytonema crispum UTEX LB 1556]
MVRQRGQGPAVRWFASAAKRGFPRSLQQAGEPFHQSPAVVLPSRSAPSPPHWRTIHDCRACFADSKELPWFPRHLRNLPRPLLVRSGGPFTTAVHGLPTVGDWRGISKARKCLISCPANYT